MQDFEQIRSYRDEEVHDILMELCKESAVLDFLPHLLPDMPQEELLGRIENIHSIEEFQKIVVAAGMRLAGKTSKSVTMTGLENVDKNKAALFISNHRDIVLDAALLNIYFISEKGYPATEVAIGDNLLVYDWIRHLARLNRTFIVQRSAASPRAFLENSQRLSAYIRQTITERNRSVWIAQREGRSKNSDDRTQDALLKMLNMSGSKTLVENFAELSICPLSISYEYDPCDYLKAKEFQQKRDNPEGYKKQPADDLLSMKTGLFGYKGQVYYHFTGNIAGEIRESISKIENKAAQITQLAQLIDQHIHRNYFIFNNNKIARDLLLNDTLFAGEYSPKEKSDFEAYLQMQIDKIDLPNRDVAFLRTRILEMYANPLINQIKSNEGLKN